MKKSIIILISVFMLPIFISLTSAYSSLNFAWQDDFNTLNTGRWINTSGFAISNGYANISSDNNYLRTIQRFDLNKSYKIMFMANVSTAYYHFGFSSGTTGAGSTDTPMSYFQDGGIEGGIGPTHLGNSGSFFDKLTDNPQYLWCNYSLTINETASLFNVSGCYNNQTIFNGTRYPPQTIDGLQTLQFLTGSGTGVTQIDWLKFYEEVPFIVNNISYTTPVPAGSYQTIYLNLTYNATKYLRSVYLVYNNNSIATTTSSGDGDNFVFSADYATPLVQADTSVPFYWVIGLSTGGTPTYYNSSVNYQVVNSPIKLTACNSTITMVAMNFTIYDEANNTLLNSSLQADLSYYSSSGSTSEKANMSYTNSSDWLVSFPFCITPNSTSLLVSGIISYSKLGYSPRQYIFDNYLINNQTQNIKLYLALATSTTPFTFTIADQSNTAVKGAIIYIQRSNGDGTYSDVGSIQTDTNGQGIFNLILNSVYYRYIVKYNGVTYLTTTPSIESGTSRLLQINLGGGSNFNNFFGITGIVSFDNSSKMVTFNFSDNSGVMEQACLIIYSLNSTSYTSYGNLCLNQSTGSINLVISDNGTYLAEGTAQLNSAHGGATGLIDYRYILVNQTNPNQVIGRFGQVITAILIITAMAIGAAANSILLGLGLMLGSIFFAYQLGWLALSIYVISGVLFVVALMIGLIAYRRIFY